MDILSTIGIGFVEKVWPLLVFFLILSVIIVIHEAGHFFAAIKSGVKVEEFGLGLGPKLFGYKKGETEYTLNAIPFGGFVRMLGEEDDGGGDPRGFAKAKLWKRMIITLAGVFMNFLSAWILLVIMLTVGSNPFLVSQSDVNEAFKKGHIGFETENFGIIESNSDLGKQIMTGWETKTPPEQLADESFRITYTTPVKVPFLQAPGFAFSEMYRISKATVVRVSSLPAEIIKKKTLPSDLGGPVRIAHVTYDLLPQGIKAIMNLVILISISLAVMNLLPIPALDGGRFLFQLFELILKPFKIQLSPKIENYIHLAGFALVMGLILAITWNDLIFIIGNNGWFGGVGEWMVKHLRI